MHPAGYEQLPNAICQVAHRVNDHAIHHLRVIGEVDVYTAPLFAAEIEKCAGAKGIIVDLVQCRHLAAAGIEVLVRLYKAHHNRLCIVVAANGFPHRVLTITEIDKLVRVLPTMEDALAYLDKVAVVPAIYVETATDERRPSANNKRKVKTALS